MNQTAKDILQGKHDDDLDTLAAAVRERRKLVGRATAAVTMATAGIGDAIRIRGISPKYLNGTEAIILHKRKTKFEIELTQDAGSRYRTGANLVIPAICVELLN